MVRRLTYSVVTPPAVLTSCNVWVSLLTKGGTKVEKRGVNLLHALSARPGSNSPQQKNKENKEKKEAE